MTCSLCPDPSSRCDPWSHQPLREVAHHQSEEHSCFSFEDVSFQSADALDSCDQGLLKFMLPLGLVYFAEYFINQGLVGSVASASLLMFWCYSPTGVEFDLFFLPRWSSFISPISSWATLSSIVGQFTSQRVTVMDLHCLNLAAGAPWLCVCVRAGTRRCTRSVCWCLDRPSVALRSGSCGSWLCCRSEFCTELPLRIIQFPMLSFMLALTLSASSHKKHTLICSLLVICWESLVAYPQLKVSEDPHF